MQETTELSSPFIKPLRLIPGDTIGLVAPASPFEVGKEFDSGVEILSRLGFKVKIPPQILERDGYLAGEDPRRAATLHELFVDQEVKAIMAVRGGYGCLRLLPFLDKDLIRSHPKIVIGFSDITVLLTVLLKACRLVTFHGPALTTLSKTDEASLASFFEVLTNPSPFTFRSHDLQVLRPGSGRARGPLLGGNLTNLIHLLATPYELDWRNAILFIEDVGEAPYRLDRALTHLAAAGKLHGLAGLLLGSFANCGDVELTWKRVLELVGDYDFPVWANFPTGHEAGNYLLPLGVEAEMDGQDGSLRILEPCVL